MQGIKGILFDKDGTLVDFQKTWGPAGREVMQHLAGGDGGLYARLAEAVSFDHDTATFPAHSMFVTHATEDFGAVWATIMGREPGVPFFQEVNLLFREAALASVSPIGDVAAVLLALRARGMALGIGTNDSEAGARTQADRLDITRHLDFIAGYDSGHGAKPKPGMVLAFAEAIGAAPHQVALVGDSLHDLHTARAAGARAIAVLTGPATRERLAPHADIIIDSIADLPALLHDPGQGG